MSDERLSSSLQENLLVLLTFNKAAAGRIRNSVELRLYGNKIYREIVSRIYDYLDQYKQPPEDHLPDLLEEELGRGDAESLMYQEIMGVVGELRGKVNEVYTLNQLERFVRLQTLKGSVAAAATALQEGKDEEAEAALYKGLKTRIAAFSPGLRLSDSLDIIFNKEVRRDVIQTGIPELDKYDLGIGRGEMGLMIGGPKSGKSWFLVHMGKQALVRRKKVCYITLELSEAQIGQRYVQSLFSMSRRKAARIPITRVMPDDTGRLLRFENGEITEPLSLEDPANREGLRNRLKRVYNANNLVIKQLPAGSTNVRHIVNYLDNLEEQEGFVPDMVIIDYADYMEIDPRNYRLEAGAIFNSLRGMAVERDLALWTAGKSNREGVKSKMITDTHSGEDYSRIYTVDTVFTYSQTAQERALGLARLYVASTRVAERDRFVTLLTQAYATGQYRIASVLLGDSTKYAGHLELAAQNQPVEDETDAQA